MYNKEWYGIECGVGESSTDLRREGYNDRVDISVSLIVDSVKELKCSKNGKDHIILDGGEGNILCVLEEGLEEDGSANTVPLNIELDYGYKTRIEKDVSITK